MLKRKYKALMKVIYNEAVKYPDETVVIRPIDLLKEIPYTSDFANNDLESTLKGLSLDGYFDYEEVEDASGDSAYKIELLTKGHAFIREIESEKRAINFKIILSVAGVIGTFILGRLITMIFGG